MDEQKTNGRILLSKEERSAKAKEAARKRWAKAKDTPQAENVPAELPVVDSAPSAPEEKHCPACLAGESLEEGEGTHILATVEHPVTLPAAFRDAETSVSIAAPPPQKPPKQKAKVMPKEFKSASSYAERRLPQAIKEKSEAMAIVAARDAEINDLVRVIKALGGNTDAHTPQPSYPNPTYQTNGQVPYVPSNPPQRPPLYPEYQQPAPVAPEVIPVKPMKAGGAGVAQGMLEVPSHWYEG